MAAEVAAAVLGIPDPEPLIARHAAHLAARDDLPDTVTERLNRLALAHFESVGGVIFDLPHHQALARRHPETGLRPRRLQAGSSDPYRPA